MGERRIDYADGRLDDVTIENVQTLRIERMDTGHWWIAAYYEDGSRDTFHLHSKRKIEADHRHEPALKGAQ